MTKSKEFEIQNLLRYALSAQQRGDLGAAEEICRTILGMDEYQADALQFLGLIEETKGNLKRARGLMEKSLEILPKQPNVLNNLANLLNDKGENEKAIDFLKRALSIQPDYWDAWFNLGKVYFDLGRYDEAETALIKARDNWQSPEPLPHTLLGGLYQNRGDFERANQNFLKALELNPDHFNALHNYGVCLKSQRRCTEALSVYTKALALKSNVPELFYNIANVHYELDNIEESLAYYRKAIELKPDFLEGHFALNELLWRQGHEDEYLQSYRQAILENPNFIDLRLNFFDALLHTGQITEATVAVSEIFKNCEVDARAYHARAKIQSLQGKIEKALADLEKSIEMEPETIVFRVDIAKFMIRLGFYLDASVHLEKGREVAPFDQDIIAYQALCWRLLGDDREKDLMDYDKFIGVYEIDLPEGYENIEQFNLALNKALDQFHLSAQQPSDQTVTGGGGTQSIAGILTCEVKEIKELRKSLQKAARQYISELPDEPDHPLLGGKADDYSFSGSFSIRLRDQGFHYNHTHPEGWISGCYYVSLPDVVKDGKTQQGWIKFGESPLGLGEKEVIEKIIQPKEGVVAFFPSYMFHGTIPFSSTQRRTTLPMDIVPTAG